MALLLLVAKVVLAGAIGKQEKATAEMAVLAVEELQHLAGLTDQTAG